MQTKWLIEIGLLESDIFEADCSYGSHNCHKIVVDKRPACSTKITITLTFGAHQEKLHFI